LLPFSFSSSVDQEDWMMKRLEGVGRHQTSGRRIQMTNTNKYKIELTFFFFFFLSAASAAEMIGKTDNEVRRVTSGSFGDGHQTTGNK
jgi:hypothetical protein